MKLEKLSRKTPRLILLGLTSVIFVAVIANFAESRWQHVFIMWCLWSIMGMGFLLLWRVGEVSVGQVAYLAIGAYTAVIMTLKFGFPFWPSLLAAGIASVVMAVLIGVIVMRLRGIYFLVMNFAFAEVIRIAAGTTEWLGGSEGMWGMPIPGDIGSLTFTTKEGWVYLFFLLAVITGLICWRIERSRIGRIYTAVGTDPALAQSLGLHLMKYRVQALVVGALTTGLAGAMQAHYVGVCSPYSYVLWPSLVALIVPIIGGVNYLVIGPLTGSLVFSLLDDFLAFAPGIRNVMYGITLLIIIFFLPEGLLSIRRRLGLRRRSETVGAA